MCGTIDPGHTYDEYLILLAKSSMTEADIIIAYRYWEFKRRATSLNSGTCLIGRVPGR
jgi:hypothetical protein